MFAQSSPVAWSFGAAQSKTINAGGKFEARLSASIGAGWYLYSLTQPPGGPNATRITLASEQFFKTAGSIKAPPPKVKFDENFGINTESYAGSVTFTIPLQAVAEAATGKQMLAVNVRFQVCNETTYLPPPTAKVETIVEIVSAAATDTKTGAAVAAPTSSPGSSEKPKTESSPQAAPSPVVSPTAVAAQTVGGGTVAKNSIEEKKQESGLLATETSANANQFSALENPTLSAGVDAAQNQSLRAFIWLAISLGALSLFAAVFGKRFSRIFRRKNRRAKVD